MTGLEMAVSSSRATSPLNVWPMLLDCEDTDVLVAAPACVAGIAEGTCSGPVAEVPMVAFDSRGDNVTGVINGRGADVGGASRSWVCKAC